MNHHHFIIGFDEQIGQEELLLRIEKTEKGNLIARRFGQDCCAHSLVNSYMFTKIDPDGQRHLVVVESYHKIYGGRYRGFNCLHFSPQDEGWRYTQGDRCILGPVWEFAQSEIVGHGRVIHNAPGILEQLIDQSFIFPL